MFLLLPFFVLFSWKVVGRVPSNCDTVLGTRIRTCVWVALPNILRAITQICKCVCVYVALLNLLTANGLLHPQPNPIQMWLQVLRSMVSIRTYMEIQKCNPRVPFVEEDTQSNTSRWIVLSITHPHLEFPKAVDTDWTKLRDFYGNNANYSSWQKKKREREGFKNSNKESR